MALATNVGPVHGVDAQGQMGLRKRCSRTTVLPFLAPLPPCLMGREASGGAHHEARELSKQGHTVKLMSPQFVRPDVKPR
jgi:transposase